jgi:hypothetical protein
LLSHPGWHVSRGPRCSAPLRLEPTSLMGPLSVAVTAHEFTLGKLGADVCRRTLTDHGKLRVLREMVELHDVGRIEHSAIGAWLPLLGFKYETALIHGPIIRSGTWSTNSRMAYSTVLMTL